LVALSLEVAGKAFAVCSALIFVSIFQKQAKTSKIKVAAVGTHQYKVIKV
jgi:hypothetical protein